MYGSCLFLVVAAYMQVASSTNIQVLLNPHDVQNLDHPIHKTARVQNLTVPNATQVKPQKRITPIMFIKPFLDNDTCTDSQDDFPNFFTDEQRKQGAIVVSFLVGIYCFTLLAVVCDNYFLPSVERICETLNLSQDVAAATFMAMATSAPELFVNIVGTFITESDIGIGTVIGSSMFNTLGVGALGSLAASAPIQVDWWPVTRDCTLYIIAIVFLVILTWDGLIYWYEGLILFIMYFLYFVVMFNNERIVKRVRRLVAKCSSKKHISTEELTKPDASDADDHKTNVIYYIEESLGGKVEEEVSEKPNGHPIHSYAEEQIKYYSDIETNERAGDKEENEQRSQCSKLFTIPKGECFKKFFFFYLWPIKLLLFCLIPNPKVYPKLFPLSFLMCVIFIGVNSYIISWMMTIIGHTFGIPDAILGLTFLAAGGCLPEAMSVVIMSRRGEGRMGVSNALGANTMNILLSLGLPWFIKTMLVSTPGPSAFIEILSGSLEYTILGLMVVAVALFLTLYFNSFKLSRRTGVVLSIIYLIFVSAAITAEMLLFEIPIC